MAEDTITLRVKDQAGEETFFKVRFSDACVRERSAKGDSSPDSSPGSWKPHRHPAHTPLFLHHHPLSAGEERDKI
jgi:hypothetical protein